MVQVIAEDKVLLHQRSLRRLSVLVGSENLCKPHTRVTCVTLSTDVSFGCVFAVYGTSLDEGLLQRSMSETMVEMSQSSIDVSGPKNIVGAVGEHKQTMND